MRFGQPSEVKSNLGVGALLLRIEHRNASKLTAISDAAVRFASNIDSIGWPPPPL